jgi:hypothetical protein
MVLDNSTHRVYRLHDFTKARAMEQVAPTTAFVVRVFSASRWGDQIRTRGSEGILTRSIPQSGTGDQTAAFVFFVSIGKKKTPEYRTRWYGAEFRSVGRQTRLPTGRRTMEHGTVATIAAEKTRTRQRVG